MSKILPQRVVETLKMFNDISVDIYGIECFLFVPNNNTTNEPNDVYSVPSDFNYDAVKTQVFIDWKPNMKMLRKFGLFAEKEVPIICWFKNNPEIKLGSYIKINIEYIPDQFDQDEFEIADILIANMHDAPVVRAYKIVPRRLKKRTSLNVFKEGI